MHKNAIIKQVRLLDLPSGSYVVYGSAPLAVAGLREASDIDLLISEELFETLKNQGWNEVDKGAGDKALKKGVCEAFIFWGGSSYNPTLEQLLKTANTFEGIPFASLKEVRNWKMAFGREKDLVDVELIDQFC